MSQAATWALFRQADEPKTMDECNERADEMHDAALSGHSGATAPTYAVAGTIWRDTTSGTFKGYDGTNWRTLHSPSVQAELTIATGAITPLAAGLIPVDTESDAASDDLDTITATNIVDGEIIILKAADDARTVVVKDGTGNIACGSDFSLDHTLDRIQLQWDAGNSSWVLLSAQSNGA